jgi:hypothetical protein
LDFVEATDLSSSHRIPRNPNLKKRTAIDHRSILTASAALLCGLPSPAAEIPLPEGRRIRDIIADKYPEGNVWNLSDGDAFRQVADKDGLIFHRNFEPKPACYAVQKLLGNPPPAD